MQCGSDDMEELIKKYRHQKRIPSTLCCFTLLLEWVGTEDAQNALQAIIGRFKTVRGARVSLPKILHHKSIHELLVSYGLEEVNPYFMQDGDLLVLNGYQTLIFGSGYFFGVIHEGEEVFDYISASTVLNPETLEDAKAYRKIIKE